MQFNDRSRSLSPARSDSRSRSDSPSRSRSRLDSPSNTRSRSRSRSRSSSRSDSPTRSSTLYGSDFEYLRTQTRDTRSKLLLDRVLRHAEMSARQGDTSTTFWCEIPDDLGEWLVDQLRSRDIYAEAIVNQDGHYDQIYLELDEYLDSASRSESSDLYHGRGTSNNAPALFLMLCLAVLFYFVLVSGGDHTADPIKFVARSINHTVHSTESYPYTDSYF